jgi:Holliday junction resolvase RusA-like endonuclease
MSETTILIPMPPSVNNLWTPVRRRNKRTGRMFETLVRTKHYKAWLKDAVPLVRCQMSVLTSPVKATITIRGGDGWEESRDLDNCLKATLDAMVAAQRIRDDSCLNVIHSEVMYLLPLKGQPACCWLTVREVSYADYTIDEC